MNEHICSVCFMPSLRHDPRHAITGEFYLSPLCCHGCGCGEEQPSDADRCFGCGHWYWRDGHWHSLVPITYADTPELAREAECPTCEGGE